MSKDQDRQEEEPHALDKFYDEEESSEDPQASDSHIAALSANVPKVRPNDHSPVERSNSSSEDRGDSFAVARRRLINVSLLLILVGAIVALAAGVVSNNVTPQSFVEQAASLVNRLGIICMLVAFVTILVSFRLRQIVDTFWAGANATRGSVFLPMLAINVVGLIVHGVLVLGAAATFGPAALWIGGTLSVTYCSFVATVAFYQPGLWRAYGIGALVTFLLLTGNSVFASPLLLSFYGMNRGTWGGPGVMWPVIALQAYVCLNGILSAGYLAGVQRLSRQS